MGTIRAFMGRVKCHPGNGMRENDDLQFGRGRSYQTDKMSVYV